jgi:hypothetical protein
MENNTEVKSEGIKPENFDELPTLEINPNESVQSVNPDDINSANNKGLGTRRFPKIDWNAIENRRMFFAMLTQTFQEKSIGRGDKSYYGSTYAWVDEYKKRDVTDLKNPSAKISVPRMNFKSPKHGVWFTFDLTEKLEYTLLQGKERGVFRLFMKNFDDDFRRIAQQQLKIANEMKEKEEKEKSEVKKDGDVFSVDVGDAKKEEVLNMIKEIEKDVE